jgi:hypothetical protein
VRTLSLLWRNRRKLLAKLTGVLWPHNFVVVVRNVLDSLRHEPWLSGDSGPVERLADASERSLAWIAYAQDRLGTGGVGSYDFSGWSTGYPEVTGYTIPTVWDYARYTGRDDLRERAVRMTDWELRIQWPAGGWEGGNEGDNLPPLVFNTGQVMRGVLRTFEETGDERYLDSARRAGDWIVQNQDEDGSWTRSNHRGLKRVYDTYVAAPLARLSTITGNERYADAARRNCDFALSHQHDNGWFELCDNSAEFAAAPVTHTICYTAAGLIETGKLLGNEAYVKAATRTADALAAQAEPAGRLPGRFTSNWRPAVGWVCLTGSAQLGVILMELHRQSGDMRYLTVSEKLIRFLQHVERLNAVGRDRRGAIAGSYPIWGSYAPFRFPCWATKYYLDLLLAVRQVRESPRQPSPAAAR